MFHMYGATILNKIVMQFCCQKMQKGKNATLSRYFSIPPDGKAILNYTTHYLLRQTK